jgi:5'-3' exonuclease
VQVHLVDGTFELFRAFYGAPPAAAPDGREVGAVRALLRSFNALVHRADVTHVACAFDQVIESFRNQLFAGYKTGAGIDPALWSQFPLAERATAALGIVTWPMVEFEADDALATGAARYAALPEVDQVVVASPDKDLTQCITSDKISCWDRIRDKRLNRAGVIEKFGVEPESIPDYLALVGDSADGIPGIPRWGAKGASAVLAHYKKLEAIPKRGQQWAISVRGGNTLADNLAERYDDALLYRTLATLRTDVPLKEDLQALRYQGAHQKELQALCEEIGEDELMSRVRVRRP